MPIMDIFGQPLYEVISTKRIKFQILCAAV